MFSHKLNTRTDGHTGVTTDQEHSMKVPWKIVTKTVNKEGKSLSQTPVHAIV